MAETSSPPSPLLSLALALAIPPRTSASSVEQVGFHNRQRQQQQQQRQHIVCVRGALFRGLSFFGAFAQSSLGSREFGQRSAPAFCRSTGRDRCTDDDRGLLTIMLLAVEPE
ncbi:Hypothetical protein ZHAS_00003951 [Anopheles sinensis]|uniref:Secreted protein n=1 Tax=Anopheles sinensis TaxID=74873 RepID=A0A084VFP6_ANOSI|nr:Hypothetical protein ZHAS_00003951 [Anopheles sinensis]